MSNTNRRLLALDPGTRKTGFAVFAGDKLLHHGVKVFANRSTARGNLEEGRQFVRSLIRTHQPQILAVEKAFFSKRTPRTILLNLYYRQILYIGRRYGLRVETYAPSTVKKFVTGYGWAKKDLVARAVVQRYPELKAYLVHSRQWQRRHHCNMFDAVAVGLIALDKRTTK
ncbi:MAG: crossover junction endodeoxyribonuclease RuvC [Candidatus Hydrogenedentota bacterium]